MKTSYVTVNFVEDQEIKLENKEEQLNQQGNTGSERERNQARKTDERTKTVSYLTGTLMDKSNDWPSVLKNCGSKKRLSRDGF